MLGLSRLESYRSSTVLFAPSLRTARLSEFAANAMVSPSVNTTSNTTPPFCDFLKPIDLTSDEKPIRLKESYLDQMTLPCAPGLS